MVDQLFDARTPSSDDLVLDPGCGPGAFIAGVLRWCGRQGVAPPRLIGIELDPGRAAEARARFRGEPQVVIVEADFLLAGSVPEANYVIGNPPYVGITGLGESEKVTFRARFSCATGRFDLYMLFLERAIERLRPKGRVVFITPEKYTYVGSAIALRSLVASYWVASLHLLPEDTFQGLITYPLVTVLDKVPAGGPTNVTLRTGDTHNVALPSDGETWRALLHSSSPADDTTDWPVLEEFCSRVSCGLATGADRIFVVKDGDVPEGTEHFAWPTLAGRDLDYRSAELVSTHRMLVPYTMDGTLVDESQLGALRSYLSQPQIRGYLEGRTCVRRKPWYAFHDSVPMREILQPKILCKDIAESPTFWLDAEGCIVPRHTVYYIVPKDPHLLSEIFEFLADEQPREWIRRHAQRAANGSLRMQSSMLKRLPIPPSLASSWGLQMRPGPLTNHVHREASK